MIRKKIKTTYSASIIADIFSISKKTITKWEDTGKLVPIYNSKTKKKEYDIQNMTEYCHIKDMLSSDWNEELQTKPNSEFTSIELFAGAGGLALGLEKAGFKNILLNEIDSKACETLKLNRPNWNVAEGDVSEIDFKKFKYKVDLLSGGFPCQAFSYAGNKLGFDDIRGTLFFEFARAINEIRPKIFLAENVKGLLSHDKGNTLKTIKRVIKELGYTLIEPKVLKALFYMVPQKRERLILIGVRDDLAPKVQFKWPSPYSRVLTLKDALKKGCLYDNDVPHSEGQLYPESKSKILKHVPQGGYWRDLPIEMQKEYMKKSFYLGGGKTGMARRLSWDEPSLTLTCSPAQKQTERCHPEETRPLTTREYARIQTFPDDWCFAGSSSSIYKQIGNAVPVNLAHAIARSLVRLLNQI